jgi:hypothetical protein
MIIMMAKKRVYVATALLSALTLCIACDATEGRGAKQAPTEIVVIRNSKNSITVILPDSVNYAGNANRSDSFAKQLCGLLNKGEK